MNSFCKNRWETLMQKQRISNTISNKWYNVVSTRYTEPQRYYHTLDHIEELLELATKFSHLVHLQDNIEYSIWFHEYDLI